MEYSLPTGRKTKGMAFKKELTNDIVEESFLRVVVGMEKLNYN
jgi:hypothetical protein